MNKSIHSKRYRQLIKKLVEARKNQKITQRDLSSKLNQYVTFVSKYETMERRLDVIEFVDVCVALGKIRSS